MGVSYRLLAMFMLSPEDEHRTGLIALVAGSAAVLVVLIGGPACLLIIGGASHPLLIALGLASVSLCFYGHDIVRLYRTRKRQKIELNARMAAWALGGLALASLLCWS